MRDATIYLCLAIALGAALWLWWPMIGTPDVGANEVCIGQACLAMGPP